MISLKIFDRNSTGVIGCKVVKKGGIRCTSNAEKVVYWQAHDVYRPMGVPPPPGSRTSNNSPGKWLYNWICCPSNRSKQIQETHTAYSAGTQYTRHCWSLNETRHTWQLTWLHRQDVIVCEAMYAVDHSNFAVGPILCTGALLIRVSFLDLFGSIAGVTNPVM